MAKSGETKPTDTAERIVESLRDNEKAALEAVREFVDTVDGAFPSVGEDSPRRRIIDAAFRMTEQLADTSSKVALGIVQAADDAIEEVGQKASADTD